MTWDPRTPAGYPPPDVGIGEWTGEWQYGSYEPIVPPQAAQVQFRMSADLYAYGLQQALMHPYIRHRLMQVIDHAMRASFKPVVLPAWHYPPYRARMYDVQVEEDRATGGTWSVLTDGTRSLTYSVPEGYTMVLKKCGTDLSSHALWGATTVGWRFVVGSDPAQGYDNWSHQMGQTELPTDIQVIVRGPATWQMQVFNTSGATVTFRARVAGWMWPHRRQNEDNAQSHAQVA